MMNAGGHEMRIATWRLDEPSALPPLLFFNGIGANLESVAPLAERMEERAFVTIDMPGIGESPDPVLPYNPVSMAWTISRILDDLGIDITDIMGFSWGGALAQQFALQHPSRVRKVVLAGTFPGMFMVPGDPSVFARMMLSQRFADAAYLNEAMLATKGNDAARQSASYAGLLSAPSARGFLYQMIALAGWTALPLLPFLSKPVLVLSGDEDQVVPPANAELLAAAIPNAELCLIPGAGHLVLLTHLDDALARLRAFLD